MTSRSTAPKRPSDAQPPEASAPKAQIAGAGARADLPGHPYENIDRAVRARQAQLTRGISLNAMYSAWLDWSTHLGQAPGRQLELMSKAGENAWTAWLGSLGLGSGFEPRKGDRRFSHDGWNAPPFRFWKQGYLAAQDWWEDATAEVHGMRHKSTERVAFNARQILDALSPSNFPLTNPEVVAKTIESRGDNLRAGFSHFAEDYLREVSDEPAPMPDGFRVGETVACTPGEVIFRNDLMELIQYAPTTARVEAEPILIVPAWIMKYYILDLSPHDSLIRFLVDKGHTVFCISWVNPDESYAGVALDDYRSRGVMAAFDAVETVLPGRKIHACGYCLGGTMLAIAAATMARDEDDRLASVTLLAAQTDFTEAGEVTMFLDENQIAYLEDMMWDQGYLDQDQMAGAFQALRAEELIWARAVQRYLMGQTERPFDISAWNVDATRMPARMHSEYLRSLFQENRLSGGRFSVEGKVIALRDIDVPFFVVGTEKDHIAPWRSVYKIRLFNNADQTFVLTSGGHNAGIVSEPGHAHRQYRIGHRARNSRYLDPDSWLATHEPQQGSWWLEWESFLTAHSSAIRVAPPAMGAADAGLTPLCPAPGTYVFQR